MKRRKLAALWLWAAGTWLGVAQAQTEPTLLAGQKKSDQAATLRLGFGGDIMAHDSNYRMRDFQRIYVRVESLLQQSELNFANLEFVIDNRRPYATYPTFNVHRAYVEAAIAAGFGVFSLANNHSTDFGPGGVRATASSAGELRQKYPQVHFSGLRPADSAAGSFRMERISQRGWVIGFSAITMLSNGLRGIEGVQYIGTEAALEQFCAWLQEEKRKGYDAIVISIHGGQEYQLEPSAPKRKIMQQIARSGADIVWGHHPHVQQPWEIYRHGGGWSLIMYSQGNFISAQPIRTDKHKPLAPWAATGDAVWLQVELGRSPSGGLELRRLQPQLLTTIRLQPFAFGVVAMEDAARATGQQGYAGWEAFYAQRQRWLEQRVALWPIPKHTLRSPSSP